MTRANLLALADRIGLYADQPEISAGAMVGDMRERIEFIGFEPDVTRGRGTPGATIIGVAFEAPTPSSPTRAPTSSSTSCSRRTSSSAPAGPTTRCSSSRPRSSGCAGELKRKSEEHHRVQDGELRGAARQPRRPARPPDPRAGAAPRARARGGGAEEPARHRGLGLRAHRPRRGHRRPEPRGGGARSDLKSELLQQSAIYAPGSPRIRMLRDPHRRAREAGRGAARVARGARRQRPGGGAAPRASTSSWRRSTRGSSSSPRTRR